VSRRRLNEFDLTLGQKLLQMNWMFIILLGVTVAIGVGMLYSAAGGDFNPWASRQMIRFGVGVAIMIVVALVDVRIWMKLAYPFYVVALILLVLVELKGSIGMGAQRWINLGFVQLQPSEVMKVALILALARYFHGANLEDVGRIPYLIVP